MICDSHHWPMSLVKHSLGVISYVEAGDLNVGATNEHQTEDGTEARNRTKNEKPELTAQRKSEFANENAAEDHPDNGRGNHHHAWSREGRELWVRQERPRR